MDVGCIERWGGMDGWMNAGRWKVEGGRRKTEDGRRVSRMGSRLGS